MSVDQRGSRSPGCAHESSGSRRMVRLTAPGNCQPVCGRGRLARRLKLIFGNRGRVARDHTILINMIPSRI
jgi:hypothetical protein